MKNVIFYFDPSCPFCWITSRWLLRVKDKRDLTIEWRPFSLAIKNNELTHADFPDTEHGPAHRVLRVMVAAQLKHGASLIDLYSTAGFKYHGAGIVYNESLITDMLSEHNLPEELLAAADSTEYDGHLQASVNLATDVAGDDIGVPTIVFTNEDGEQQGFFGPVLQTLPDMDESLDLWDGLSKLATNSSFYELKRSRPAGGPDVASTTKC